MATPLKDLYSPDLYNNIADLLGNLLPSFDKKAFLTGIFDEGWEQKELKERMRHTSHVLKEFLPSRFEDAAALLLDLIASFRKSGLEEYSIEYMWLPDYVEVYGLEDWETSMHVMEQMTTFTSCEFAVRPFILRKPRQSLQRMLRWAEHENHHVRRLASEGSRPRLPWAMALPFLKDNPEPTLPILEKLKQDPSEYVRRSVANHINDISKDHPEVTLRIATQWKDLSPETNKLLKHACRTLLKAGNPAALDIFGLGYNENIQINHLTLQSETVAFGDYLTFHFELSNHNVHDQIIRLEYAIYYQKANGSLSKKVYKISEKNYQPNQTVQVKRRQAFKPISTRTFHPGLHQLAIILNGKECEPVDFMLQM